MPMGKNFLGLNFENKIDYNWDFTNLKPLSNSR